MTAARPAWTALAGLCLILATGGGVAARAEGEAPPARPAAGPSRDQIVSEAVERSAELAALREQIAAAEASLAPAGALPDPMLSAGVSNLPVWGVQLDRTPMSGVDIGLSQRVPGATKRRLRRELKGEDVSALKARYRDGRSDLVRRVKRAYIAIQDLDDALEIAEETKHLAEEFLATAEARYATGRGIQQDVLRTQVRLSRMLDALVDLRQRRAAAATRLNRLRYRAGTTPIPRLPSLTRTARAVGGDPLGERAEAANPRLAELRVRLRQARTSERLAAEGLTPDVTLGLRYRIRARVPMDPVGGEDFWSASVGINLPWLYREDTVDREVEAAEARARAAEHSLDRARNDLAARIEETLIDLLRADERLALLETGLLPQAEAALASSRAAYGTGQVDLLTLLDNQMTLYLMERDRIHLIAEHERNLAELEYVLGESSWDEAGDGGGEE